MNQVEEALGWLGVVLYAVAAIRVCVALTRGWLKS